MEHSSQWFLTIPVTRGNTRLKAPLGSFRAKLGDGRQQLYVILVLKWGSAVVKLSRVLPFFVVLPDIFPQSVLAPRESWTELSPLRRQGAAAQSSEVARLSMRHCSFWLSTVSPHPSWDRFQSLVVIRRGTNMRGQHLIRAGHEKFTGFQCNGPFSFSLHFLEEEATGFMSIFKPFVPRDAEGDSQELHTTYWNTWAASHTQAQLCVCSPAGVHGPFGTDSRSQGFLPQNHRD